MKLNIIVNSKDDYCYEFTKTLKESEDVEVFKKNCLNGLGAFPTISFRADDEAYYIFKTSEIQTIIIKPIKE